MDLDAFAAIHRPQWERLDTLSRKGALTSAESMELVELFQTVSTHLSIVRSSSPDPELVLALSRILTQARRRAFRARWTLSGFATFFTHTFPTALYLSRRWWLSVLVIFHLSAAGLGWWVATHPQVHRNFGSTETVRRLVEEDFVGYYSEFAAQSFAATVWTNNAWVSALCIALGVTGIGVIQVLAVNAINLGAIGGLMAYYGGLSTFFSYILPHGLLELTCVMVAGGSGLMLFWSWVVPGALPRAEAFAHAGRTLIVNAAGLAVVLFFCALIEAFVTPSSLPTWLRIGIGAAAWLLFLFYALWLGRVRVREAASADVATTFRPATAVAVP